MADRTFAMLFVFQIPLLHKYLVDMHLLSRSLDLFFSGCMYLKTFNNCLNYVDDTSI